MDLIELNDNVKSEKPSKNKQNIEETRNCPSCGSSHLTNDYSRAEIVCETCGLVLDAEIIDHGPEWRSFDQKQQEKKARTGAPINYTLHDKGLSTMISWQNKDAYGKSIPPRNRAQLYRLRKWQSRTRISDNSERNLATALSSMNQMSSALNLPRNVRETAAMIYRKAVRRNFIRGRTIQGVSAAVLYAACRQCNVPRTLEEISTVSDMSKKEIGKNYRNISRKLKLKLLPTNPQDYISRFSSNLHLNTEVQSKSLEILEQASKKELTSGRGPTGLAAAALYMASVLCCDRRTQREVAEIAGVTEVTIRNRYKELSEKLDIDLIL